jgi:hypothetical protein
MRLALPDKPLRDDMMWGFRPEFDDAAYLASKHSPRSAERFGDADHPVPDGRPLDQIVRDLCSAANVSQPFIWAKFIGETSFLTAATPLGKGYKAPLGYDCPDGGRDPRPQFYGVVPNIRGAINWWGQFRSKWEWERRLRDGLTGINVRPEGQGVNSETVKVRTAAEVAYLIYTPHLYSLRDFMGILGGEFPQLFEGESRTMSKYVEPIGDMSSRRTNVTLHGRSVHRPENVSGHNVFKGYSTWAENGHHGVGDGVDLFAEAGTEVYAIADGVQTKWQGDATRKEVIYLEGEDWLAVYAHINAAKEGTNLKVAKGELVGKVRSDLSDPHVHFELWLGGSAVHARTSGGLRDTMRAKLCLTSVVPQPGDPRLIVAKPAAGAQSLDGFLYLQVPSRWDNARGAIEVETAALAKWLAADGSGLPEFEHVREALDAMHITTKFDLTHLHDTSDPRVYVFAC